jgi:hypothetical protein
MHQTHSCNKNGSPTPRPIFHREEICSLGSRMKGKPRQHGKLLVRRFPGDDRGSLKWRDAMLDSCLLSQTRHCIWKANGLHPRSRCHEIWSLTPALIFQGTHFEGPSFEHGLSNSQAISPGIRLTVLQVARPLPLFTEDCRMPKTYLQSQQSR